MAEQKQKLMAMLGLAVANLAHPETVVPALQDLGRKHVAYGTQAAHYEPVGAALLWTLEQGLGPNFTPEVREAWTETFALVARVMQQAAAEAA
jgi:hemoglobin-like flavoprotein